MSFAARERVGEGQVVRALRALGLSAHGAGELIRLAVVALGSTEIAHPVGESSGGLEGGHPRARIGTRQCEHTLGPDESLAQIAADLPEPPEREQEARGRVGVTSDDRVLESGAHVVMLELDEVEPAPLVVALELRRGTLGQGEIGREVAIADGGVLTARAELLVGELPDRDQHAEPGFARGVLLTDEAAVEQLRGAVQDAAADLARGSADRLELLEHRTRDEHGTAREEAPQPLVEKVVAPGDRATQRALAVGAIR